MGKIHSQAYHQIPGVEFTVVADLDPNRRAQAQQHYGVDVVNNLEEMLKTSNVDLVDICVPTYLHAAVMAQAIKANKHVFCEKPLARSLEESQRLVDMSTGYEQKIGIGHVVRFTPD